jgi:type 1 fimbriae regulatory protein FimB/type 1 fimbriae regulatory protein FimE
MSELTPSLPISGTVLLNRRANDRLRAGRKHLTQREIERLMDVARRRGRYGHRDAAAILIAFRNGFRASELCGLEWNQFDFIRGTLEVRRVKGGETSTHYLNGGELLALRRVQRENEPGRFVFVGERGDQVTTAWFCKMLSRRGTEAAMPFPIHPHMLRHACGFKFANQGKDTRSLQAYLGHRNVHSTAIYAAMSPERFKGWQND